MKHLFLILFAVAFAAPLYAQESVIIKEPAGQCYQDLKAKLPEAIRWDDEQMTVTSRPLMTTAAGNVELVARIFPEPAVNKKTKERVEICKLVVGIVAPQQGTAWNALNSSPLRQNASLMKARIESAMKEREKKLEKENKGH